MELKKLIKNTSYLSGVSIVQFIVGIIRSKLNAVLLGVAGVGIVNQLYFLTTKMAQFTTLSMNSALVKQVSENKNNEKNKELIQSSLKSYTILILSFMLVSILVFYIYSKDLSTYVFGDTKYLIYFYVGLFSLPMLILNTIPASILQGFKDVKTISIARVGIIVINITIFIPLVYFLRLKGAIAFVPLSYIVTLLINYFFANKYYFKRLDISLKTIFLAKINKKFIKELFLFSGIGIIIGSYGIFSEFVCRSIVVKQLGVDSIGLYSPIISWSGLFVGFILPSFSTYLFPRFAESKSNSETSGIINDALRLGTFLLMPLLFLAIPYRDFFIKLFYSKEFLEAGKYLPYHFIGIIFYVWWFAFMVSMTPTGRIKQHGFFMLFYLSLDIVVVYLTVPVWGLYGWMLEHIISPVIFFIVYAVYNKASINFKFLKSNLMPMLYLLLGSLILVLFMKVNIFVYIAGPLFLLLSWLFLTKNEQDMIIVKLLEIKKRLLR